CAVEPGDGIAEGIGTDHRHAVVTGEERARAPRGCGVVTERDAVAPVAATPVPGERDPHGAARDERADVDAGLFHHARARALDDDVGRLDQRPPGGRPELDADAALARVHQVEERRWSAPGAVRTCPALDLHDVAAGKTEETRAQRPGPQC